MLGDLVQPDLCTGNNSERRSRVHVDNGVRTPSNDSHVASSQNLGSKCKD